MSACLHDWTICHGPFIGFGTEDSHALRLRDLNPLAVPEAPTLQTQRWAVT
jgi:hypothetical protein